MPREDAFIVECRLTGAKAAEMCLQVHPPSPAPEASGRHVQDFDETGGSPHPGTRSNLPTTKM